MKRNAMCTGLERERMLEWLRAFAAKAQRDRRSLELAELDELARVVALLTPEDDEALAPSDAKSI